MKVGLLTGGGDCPGLNAVIRAVVRRTQQRGGSPTAFDRIIGTRFGIRALDLVREGRFGHMVALHDTRIDAVPLSEATAGPKQMDLEQFADTLPSPPRGRGRPLPSLLGGRGRPWCPGPALR